MKAAFTRMLSAAPSAIAKARLLSCAAISSPKKMKGLTILNTICGLPFCRIITRVKKVKYSITNTHSLDCRLLTSPGCWAVRVKPRPVRRKNTPNSSSRKYRYLTELTSKKASTPDFNAMARKIGMA